VEKKTNLAELLRDFANLQRSVEAIARFQKKWPDFLPPKSSAVNHIFRLQTPTGEEIPIDVPEDQHYVLWLQRIVQLIWLGSPDPIVEKELEGILLTGGLALNSNMPFLKHLNSPPLPGVFTIDAKRGVFVYKPQTLLQEALYYLMQNSSLAKVCANRESCPAPYFIAPRSNTRYCSEDCLNYKQRESKREWWQEKGEQWREDRKKKSKSVRGKQ
jgi:hypothetical protein